MGRVKAAAKGSPEKKQRKQRKKKDKDAPKRPCTAFFYYVLHQRACGEHEGMKVSEFTKQCGARWRGLTKEDKETHFDSAATDKKRYEEQMKIYKPSACKDATKPKKPMTPFLLFVGSVRKQLVEDGVQHKEVLGKAAEQWREITDADKKPFTKEAAELKKAYEANMKKWNEEQAAAAKAAKAKPKPAAPQKNGKDSDDEESEEESEEEEEEEEEEDDDEDMESDDE
ncbi:high mobility group protein B1-like [Lineus longissimus]|uniref:high mobility group protein B1-like n=1 Tax=Lineus longissimus TaxID=88925 RepID=UPI002B4E9A01